LIAPEVSPPQSVRDGVPVLALKPRRVMVVLAVAAGAIVLYGLVSRVLAEPFPQPFEELSRLGDERRLPSWFQACALLLAAGLCLACGVTSGRSTWRWRVLAAIVASVSIEETAGVHRAFREQLASTPGNGAVIDYAAIAVLVVLVVAGTRGLVDELVPDTRKLLLWSVGIYVAALLLDAAGHALTERSLGHDLLGVVEEGLESGAVVLLVGALLTQAGRCGLALLIERRT
jgi:hypothetical protein